MSAPRRPERIDQVVHILAARDAIGTHVIHTRQALRTAGYPSDIFAGDAHPEVRHVARPLTDLPDGVQRDTWLLLHHSTGDAVAEAVLRREEPKLIDYHNITPPSLVSRWAPWIREELELGLDQLAALAPASIFGIAHSAFSEAELHAAGCHRDGRGPAAVRHDGCGRPGGRRPSRARSNTSAPGEGPTGCSWGGSPRTRPSTT